MKEIGRRVLEVSNGSLTDNEIQEGYLKGLMGELDLRFDHLMDPCLASIA